MSQVSGWRLVRAARFPDRESAETSQLDPVAARQRRRHLVEDRGDDDLNIVLVKLRVGLACTSPTVIPIAYHPCIS